MKIAAALLTLLSTGELARADEPPVEEAPAQATSTPGPALTLAEALHLADSRNLTLAATRLEIDKAQAQLHQAWGTLLPFFGGQVGYTHNDQADSAHLPFALPAGTGLVVRRQDELRASLQASVPLINPQAWLGVSAARLGVDVTTLTVENAREELLFAVATAYWFAVVNHELVLVEVQQLNAARRHLTVTRARVAQGDAMRIDVVRADTEVEKARQDLISVQLAFDNARDALGTLTASKDLPMPAPPPSLPAPEIEDEAALADRVAKRPDVQAARVAVALNDRLLSASWMQLLPTLGLVGQYNYLFTKPTDLGSPDRSRWALLLTLSVPLYNEVRYADLDAKRAALKQAELHAEDIATGAALQVRKARRDYLASIASLDTAARQAALTREALTLAESAYTNGANTSLDVTDAQRTFRTAEINAATQRLRSQMSLLTLLKATGHRMAELGEAAP